MRVHGLHDVWHHTFQLKLIREVKSAADTGDAGHAGCPHEGCTQAPAGGQDMENVDFALVVPRLIFAAPAHVRLDPDEPFGVEFVLDAAQKGVASIGDGCV